MAQYFRLDKNLSWPRDIDASVCCAVLTIHLVGEADEMGVREKISYTPLMVAGCRLASRLSEERRLKLLAMPRVDLDCVFEKHGVLH